MWLGSVLFVLACRLTCTPTCPSAQRTWKQPVPHSVDLSYPGRRVAAMTPASIARICNSLHECRANTSRALLLLQSTCNFGRRMINCTNCTSYITVSMDQLTDHYFIRTYAYTCNALYGAACANQTNGMHRRHLMGYTSLHSLIKILNIGDIRDESKTKEVITSALMINSQMLRKI